MIERYYNGQVKCKRLSDMTPLKTALYECLEDGEIGSNNLGFRKIKIGEMFIAPVRRCYKKLKD